MPAGSSTPTHVFHAICTIRLSSSVRLLTEVSVARSRQASDVPAHENAPSRWRLRPAFRLTAAEAAADRRAINLGRSVLGACTTLGIAPRGVKDSRDPPVAICELFFSHQVSLRNSAHALEISRGRNGPATTPAQEFAEPGALSSTVPTDLPLPRTAAREASSYRRPVLGAAGLYAKNGVAIKAGSERISRYLRRPCRPRPTLASDLSPDRPV
jgi:hypothetical protein